MKQNSFKSGQGGFTLIELLVVIAIIGILSSVVLVSLGGARAKARDARRISDIGQLRTALELYSSTHSRYPTTQEFSTTGADGAPPNGPFYLVPTFIPTMPTDPVSLKAYDYVGTTGGAAGTVGGGACASYHIGTQLEGDNPVLQTRAAAPENLPLCSAGSPAFTNGPGFNGSVANYYDLVP